MYSIGVTTRKKMITIYYAQRKVGIIHFDCSNCKLDADCV